METVKSHKIKQKDPDAKAKTANHYRINRYDGEEDLNIYRNSEDEQEAMVENL